MGFFGQLLNLVASPLGLVGLIAIPFILSKAKRSPKLVWFLVAACCFTASLAEFRDEFTLEAPALVFPLQQLRSSGRPLTILLLGILLWLGIGLPKQPSWRRHLMPAPIGCIAAIQLLLFLKTLGSGSITLAFLAIITFTGVVLMIRLGPSRWLQNDATFDLAIWSIAVVGIIFILTNSYQALFDPYPITFVQDAFLGTTGNPQHAATLLATTVPCLLFLIEKHTAWKTKSIWIMALIAVFYALFLTASRTGALMGIVSVILFYRQRQRALLHLGLCMAVILPIAIMMFGDTSFSVGTGAIDDQLFNIDNTRAGVWAAQLRGFNQYPIFGVPLRGDRFIPGENSWLAVAASLGSVGLIPLILFSLSCFQMIYQLTKMGKKYPTYVFHCNTIVAGLLSLIVGSIFEGFLLGTLTFPLIALFIYLSLGQYLIDLYHATRDLSSQYLIQNSNPYAKMFTGEQKLEVYD
ncbi:MAG: O-antigen ligase family protein [Cyanobacteria bacterium P01_F01_bin.150]